MSHGVQKYILVTGPHRDIAFIYRHAANIIDLDTKEIKHTSPYELGELAEKLGCLDADEIINFRGGSLIESIDFENGGTTLCITIVTPHGYVQEFMEWLRQRFHDCRFLCFKDYDDRFEDNEYD